MVHPEWLKWPFRPGPFFWWRPHLLDPHYQPWTSSWADRKSLHIFFHCPSPRSLPVHPQNNRKVYHHNNRSICRSSSITLNEWTSSLFISSRYSSYFPPFVLSFCIFNKPLRVDVFLIFLNWHLQEAFNSHRFKTACILIKVISVMCVFSTLFFHVITQQFNSPRGRHITDSNWHLRLHNVKVSKDINRLAFRNVFLTDCTPQHYCY